MRNDVQEVIQKTVDSTVERLKREGMMRDSGMTPLEKTEHLLRYYNDFRASGQEGTAKTYIEDIDRALERMKDDRYVDIIKMMYFEGKTREMIAEELETSTTTVSRNKKRLLNIIAASLFPNEYINNILY